MDRSTDIQWIKKMNVLDNIRKNLPTSAKATLAPQEIARLEATLGGTMVPLTPRREFVERLNRQLITSAPLTRHQPAPLALPDPKTRESLLIGAATLVGAAAIFATGFRVAITVLGTVGILVQWLNRKSLEKQTPIQTAS